MKDDEKPVAVALNQRDLDDRIAAAKEERANTGRRRCSYCAQRFEPQLERIHVPVHLVTQSIGAREAAAMLAGFCSFACQVRHALETVNSDGAWWQLARTKPARDCANPAHGPECCK